MNIDTVDDINDIFDDIKDDQNDDQDTNPTDVKDTPDVDPLFSYLKEKSLIEVEEDFDYTSEDALERALELTAVKREERAVQSLMESLPDDFKSILEYGLNGGSSLQEYFSAYGPLDLDSLDLSSEEGQERVLKAYWKETSNFKDEKIDKLIERLKASDSLEEEAKETVTEWKQLRETRKQEFIQKQKEHNAELNRRAQQRAEELTRVFESYEAPKERKGKIKTLFSQGEKDLKFNEVLSQATSNYEHLVQLADFLADYDPKKGFAFERFEKRAESAKAKGLRDILESKINQKPQTKGSPKINNDDFDFEKFLTL